MKKEKFKILVFLIPFFAISVSFAASVDVDRATRETDRLNPEEIEKKLVPAHKKPEEIKPPVAPAVEGETKVFVKNIKLSGNESIPSEEFSSIIKDYENKEVTLTQLQNLAKEIEREYLRKGVIAAVFVPPQELKEGTVILQVVEAKMGQLKVDKQKYFSQERLYYYWKVPTGEILHYGRISKSLQLMNKNPDREVKATLSAGQSPGTTDVILTSKTKLPAHFTYSFDNEGSTPTGLSRIGFGARHNNFLGLDDTLLTGYNYGRDFNAIYAYHSVPVSSNGTTLVYGYSQSKSHPTKEYAPYDINSKAQNTSIALHQDLYSNKDEYLGEAFAGFDAKDKATKMNTGTYSRDRLRIFTLGSNFLKQGFGSNTTFSLEINQGVPDFLGASSNDNPLMSRGAKADFTKFKFGLQYRKILPLGLQGNFKFKSQLASTKLTPQEEFGLGGIDSVRGYPADDYLADNAVLANAELLIPSFFIPAFLRLPLDKNTLKQETTLVVFVDQGWGDLRGPSSTDKKSMNLTGVGAGLRFKLFNQALLRLEWGVPVGDHALTEGGHSHFHFSVDFQS